MAQSRTIRKWALETGRYDDLSEMGPIPAHIRRDFREAHADMPEGEPAPVAPPDASEPIEEVAPKLQPDEPVISRVASRVRKARTSKPRGRKVRLSVASLISEGWQYLAIGVSRFSAPVGWMMDNQAPVAGLVLDEPIAGTVLDKILQPFAKVEQTFDPVNALIGPLVCAYLMDRFPDQQDKIIPRLRKSLMSYARVTAPYYDKLEETETQLSEQFGGRIDDIIESLQMVITLSHQQKAQ